MHGAKYQRSNEECNELLASLDLGDEVDPSVRLLRSQLQAYTSLCEEKVAWSFQRAGECGERRGENGAKLDATVCEPEKLSYGAAVDARSYRSVLEPVQRILVAL